jgi:hypothetical protein
VTDDSGTIPQKRDRSTAPAAHRSEIERRSEELRDIARACTNLNEFAKAVGWRMEIARHANQVLSLGLGDARLQTGPKTEAKAVPKPVKRK